MNLQQAVFAGKVNPGQINAVREVVLPNPLPPADCGVAAPLNCDTALFSGLQAEYTITPNANGSITVRDLADPDPANTTPIAPAFQRDTDGFNDTLWNMEQIQFCAVFDAVNRTCTTRSAPVSLVAPQAQATPAAVAFADQGPGTVSPVQIVTVNNLGFNDLTVSAVAIVGGTAFTVTGETCTGAVVPRGESCTVSVQFAPTLTGAQTATLNITSNSNNVPGTVTPVDLTGTGAGAIAAVSPGALVFANQNVGTQSAIQAVTISNTGNVALTGVTFVLGGTDPGDFIRTGNCGTVAPAASCSFNMRFRPTTAGAKSATLTINHPNNSGLLATVLNLSGTAVVQAPQLTVSPLSAPFGNVQLNSTALRTVDVTNSGTGTVAMPITVVASGAGFTRATVAQGAVAPNCGATVAAGVTCKVTVRFAPTVANGGGGLRTGNLAVTATGIGTIVNTALSATGTIAAVADTNTVGPVNGVVTAQNIDFNVRANDAPVNVGAVTPDTINLPPNGFTIVNNGGAAATATVLANNQIRWTLTPVGANAAARAASKRGTYRYDYILTSGTATSTATYTLTVN
jgi:Abnormal spindle-like microcephaly-assoc'd, ASPM-SPD-2-Hydin